MKQYAKLKIVLACYAFYMIGGVLSAIFEETNNRAGTIIAVALPTLVAMICVTILTQPQKKRLPPMRVQATRK